MNSAFNRSRMIRRDQYPPITCTPQRRKNRPDNELVDPFDCLHLEDVQDPQSPFFSMMTVDESKCTGCRECEKACPYDAIFVYRKDQIPGWLAPNIRKEEKSKAA